MVTRAPKMLWDMVKSDTSVPVSEPVERVETPRNPEKNVSDADSLSHGQLVEQIVAMNPTATFEFLSQFSRSALELYLSHLVAAQEPRGRHARWIRQGDSPAIVWSELRA